MVTRGNFLIIDWTRYCTFDHRYVDGSVHSDPNGDAIRADDAACHQPLLHGAKRHRSLRQADPVGRNSDGEESKSQSLVIETQTRGCFLNIYSLNATSWCGTTRPTRVALSLSPKTGPLANTVVGSSSSTQRIRLVYSSRKIH